MQPFEITAPLATLEGIFRKEGHELRFVGGFVRDRLLGKAPKDIDLATDADVGRMLEIAERHGFLDDAAAKANREAGPDRRRVIQTGVKHGTLTFVIGDTPCEITMLRIDVACDGRHAEVEHTTDWKADAARRDLTINAMSMDFAGRLYDYFGGRDDLDARIVRLVGDPDARITEDALRILRLWRMTQKWESGPAPTIDPASRAAACRHTGMLDRLSGERVWSEMQKILTGPRAPALLEDMHRAGVLEAIGVPWRAPAEAEAAHGRGVSALGMLASQMGFAGEAERLADRWRMSNEERQRLRFLVAEKGRVSERRIEDLLVDGTPRAWAVDLARLAGAAEARARTFDPPQFPLAGRDLVEALGMKPGPQIGARLRQARAAWVESRFALTREDLLEPFRRPPAKERGAAVAAAERD